MLAFSLTDVQYMYWVHLPTYLQLLQLLPSRGLLGDWESTFLYTFTKLLRNYLPLLVLTIAENIQDGRSS